MTNNSTNKTDAINNESTGGSSNKAQQQQDQSPAPTSSKPPKTPSYPKNNASHISNLRILHQKSELSFGYSNDTIENHPLGGWADVKGVTTLYVIDEDDSSSSGKLREMALCFRGGGIVTDVQVCTVRRKNIVKKPVIEEGQVGPENDSGIPEGNNNNDSNDKCVSVEELSSYHHHFDPLSKILLRPGKILFKSFNDSNSKGKSKTNDVNKEDDDKVKILYDADSQCVRGGVGMTLSLRASCTASSMGELRIMVNNEAAKSSTPQDEDEKKIDSEASSTLVEQCWLEDLIKNQHPNSQQCERRQTRYQYIAHQLSLCASTAFKVTVEFIIPSPAHLPTTGGLHFHPSHPVIYTTSGTYGDPMSGPRTWLPCLDSASRKHRSSQELTINTHAPTESGLNAVGCGEDYGQHTALPHHNNDGTVLHTFRTDAWNPIPVRFLGFAIGPFLEIPDPEYDVNTPADDNDDMAGGVRQMILCPLHLRKHIHAPNTEITTPQKIRKAVLLSTSGIPLRALTLTKDLLSLVDFPFYTYTQVWIPNVVDGGFSSGTLKDCGTYNSFLGGAILDSRLLYPIDRRLPYFAGGRVLQMQQAMCAIMGWVGMALPLSGDDDVGDGYLHTLFGVELLSLYERVYGGSGENAGSKFSGFWNGAMRVSEKNDQFLDWVLPILNVEEEEDDINLLLGNSGGTAANVGPLDDKNNEETMWRSPKNGTESHTNPLDEFHVRNVLFIDMLEVFERGLYSNTNTVPLPSMGWLGSHLAVTFLSSNSCSSEKVGCGAVELLHPNGGLFYRMLKCRVVAKMIEGRAGIANFIRVIRASFIAAILGDQHKDDSWEEELKVANTAVPDVDTKTHDDDVVKSETLASDSLPSQPKQQEKQPQHRPPFLLCMEEILTKQGMNHSLFIRSLRLISGPIREPYLRGSLVDVSRSVTDTKGRHFTSPEGFPNSYLRGSSSLYMRVGSHVEPAGGATEAGPTSAASVKGIHLHVYSEPVVPEGGCIFPGPMTLRVVENEGQCREFVRNLNNDGSRKEWGPIFLHAKVVTTAKQQTAASGAIEGGPSTSQASTSNQEKNHEENDDGGEPSLNSKTTNAGAHGVFTREILHGGGYQALELVRLTNRTPLLWIRVDPHGLYGGKIAIFQQDACLAEQLFHDGDAAGQIDAIRALAERPLKIQGSVKIQNVFDVSVRDLPVRVLGDCLRGSAALHSSLPHTPVVRAQVALAIAQWQNNKAPHSKDAIGADSWLGLNILIQYFQERFFSNGTVLPVKFTRVVAKKPTGQASDDTAAGQTAAVSNSAGVTGEYQYMDTFDKELRTAILEIAEEVEVEEDEEYRVRSAVITGIASIRAKDGQTPPRTLRFLEAVLLSGDGSVLPVEDDFELPPSKRQRYSLQQEDDDAAEGDDVDDIGNLGGIHDLAYESSSLVADALLSLCHLNARPAHDEGGAHHHHAPGIQIHPLRSLADICHRWLDWELYKEKTWMETEREVMTGIGGGSCPSVAACAITALCSLAILIQSTTADSPSTSTPTEEEKDADKKNAKSERATSVQFYIDIFDARPLKSDVVRAAAAQAVVCIACAADRLENVDSGEPLGLLTALEFLLDRILETSASFGLRHTLACIMLDACMGKACSMQRVAAIGGRNDMCSSGVRFITGPLGSSYGGDNGSALLMDVTAQTYPAANAVNDGARLGLGLLNRAGRDGTYTERTVVRVAIFGTRLWRTINGEDINIPSNPQQKVINANEGICARDGHLRASLLALWQRLWPKTCIAILRVQSWSALGTHKYKGLGTDRVMSISEEEKEACKTEESTLNDLKKIVDNEVDRQKWRGDMAKTAFEYWKREGRKDPTGQEAQGLGHPLPVVEREKAWKLGGWVASAAQQRRAMALDGGTAVTKVRLTVKNNNE